MPGCSCVAGLIGWAELGSPFHWQGALVFVVLALLIIPLLLMLLVFWLPVFFASLWPRRWRRWYRHWRMEDHFLLPGATRDQQKSSRIYTWMRNVTLAADRYQCIYGGDQCLIGSGRLAPQIDHSVPWSLGGLTALWNMFTLCAKHNRIKSNYWKSPTGRVIYRPFPDADDEAIAADILYVERWHRWNPFRMWRAARALGWLF